MDVEGWILIAIAAVMGFLAAWFADSHNLSENMAKAATYYGDRLCLLDNGSPTSVATTATMG